jgi:ribosome biogenesis protein Nip4
MQPTPKGLNEAQKQQASELLQQGFSPMEVFRHLGAEATGRQSTLGIKQETIKEAPTKPSLANKFTELVGLGDATQVFGKSLARAGFGGQNEGQQKVSELTGMSQQEINQTNIEAPTAGQLGGAALQTAAVALSPAIAPIGLGASMLTGGALGYAYDIGSDMIAQKSLGEILTPGGGTAAGVLAPPVVKGAFSVLKKPIEAGAKALSSSFDDIKLPSLDVNVPPVLKEGVADVGARFKRLGERAVSAVDERIATAERLRTATPAVREAVKTKVDDVVIDLATNSDQPTKDALKKMVEIAEQPKTARPTAGPASVASDVAVDQYKIIENQRKTIGEQIGQLSDELPTLKNIDIAPTQDNVINVLQKNGITLDIDGKLSAGDNMKVSDEQLAVLNKIWQKVTSRQNLSARNLHELDQWFSSTQRTARSVDQVEDLYIKVPTQDGKEVQVPIYKFFRDAFGQRLDEVAPDNLRELNKQYRSLSNLTDDVEATLVKNSNLETLQNVDISNPSALRRMFGEAQSAEDFRLIYEQMDALSRQLGYSGARADELYYFANKLRDYYPETIPETGFRGSIFSSIQDALGGVLEAGKPNTIDQQKAIKMLLDLQ